MTAIDDGYGDVRHDLDAEVTLPAYERWLHKVAYVFQPPGRDEAYHDDLVQEGRVAMWRAMAAYDPSKGALPSWLTTAAKLRMADVVRRAGTWLGRPPRYGPQPVAEKASPAMSLDELLAEGGDSDSIMWMLSAADVAESLELAYHHGEIMLALNSLRPDQRRYVVLRFWGGLSDPEMVRRGHFETNPGYLWRDQRTGARGVLRARLANLASAA
jgi:RNA polymerase sigma factor (sigma-70 family)